MADGTLLDITQVREATGLEASALRYYEREGLISSVGRASGRRIYESAVLDRLAAIALFQEVGFTIAEIGRLLRPGADPERWQAVAQEKLAEIDAHIERARLARDVLASTLACDCSGFETCDLVASRKGRHGATIHRLSLGPARAPR